MESSKVESNECNCNDFHRPAGVGLTNSCRISNMDRDQLKFVLEISFSGECYEDTRRPDMPDTTKYSASVSCACVK